MVAGVKIDYDTCLGINDVEVSNQLYIIGDSKVMFSAGSTIVVKNLSSKAQMVLAHKNKLRNVTAMHAREFKQKIENLAHKKKLWKPVLSHAKTIGGGDRTDRDFVYIEKNLITIGESSIDKKNDISIHVVIAKFYEKSIWKSITTTKIRGKVKVVESSYDKKTTIALIHKFNESPVIYLWNYERDKLIAHIELKFKIKSVSLHPRKDKRALFFSSNHLKLWDYTPQSKTFEERDSLVSQWIENEDNFIDYRWMTNKYTYFLLVLCNPNKILFFQNDTLKDTIQLDLNSLSMVPVDPRIYKVSEVDETYGFKNVLDAKIREEDHDDEMDEEHMLEELKKKEDLMMKKDLDQNYIIKNFDTFKDGFVVAATGGLLAYFVIDKFERIRDQVKKVMLSNPQNYKLKKFDKNDHIFFISVNKKFSLTTLIVKNNLGTDYYLLNDFDIKEESNKIENFFQAGFHKTKVLSVGLSRARSTFVTSGKDNVVRIWLYDTVSSDMEKRGLMYSENQDVPTSVSLHPFGFFLAVAFSNGFKVYTLLKDKFFLLKEKNLINCNYVLYSDGGQYLFSNEKSVIYVFDSVYYSHIYKFECHDSKIHRILCIKDRYVISNCTRGRIFFWEIEDKEKGTGKLDMPLDEGEDFIKKCLGHEHTKPYNSYVYDFERDLFVACLPEK